MKSLRFMIMFLLMVLLAFGTASIVLAIDPTANSGFYMMTREYALNNGTAVELNHLGIGTYNEQLTKLTASVKIIPPDDGIKRGNDKTIYNGADNRRDFYQIPTSKAKENARAVASISNISESKVPARGMCTAFLIARDKVMTASHCVNNNDFRMKVVRFNDHLVGDGFLGDIDSYEIESIDIWDNSYDFTVLTLKPNSSGQFPGDKFPILRLQKTPLNKLGVPLYMIGHPGREYKKYGECSLITQPYIHKKDGKHTFGCDCNAFGGNSGSPIFAADTQNIVGMLWGGQHDDRRIQKADKITHEYAVPIWEINESKSFDYGNWPKDVPFVAFLFK